MKKYSGKKKSLKVVGVIGIGFRFSHCRARPAARARMPPNKLGTRHAPPFNPYLEVRNARAFLHYIPTLL